MRKSLKNICRLIESANEEVPIEKSFLDDLKRSIEISDSKNRRKPSKSYKPSSMNCIRNMFYQIHGDEPDPSESSYSLVGICNSGTDIHVRVQIAVSQMRVNGMDCDYINVADFVRERHLDDLKIVSQNGMETKLYHKKLNMSFLCDGIIKYQGKYFILEIKTESSYKFMNRREVDPSHYNQGVAYSYAFGLDNVIFLYVNRDVLDMKDFKFSVTQKMRDDLVSLMSECDSFIAQNILPPKPVDVSKKTCSYCSYKSRCLKDEL